jgi:hypothetical protein
MPVVSEPGDPPAETWRVYFNLGDRPPDNLTDAALDIGVAPENFAVITELLPDGQDGEATLGLVIYGEDEAAALSSAMTIYRAIMAKTGLSVDPEQDLEAFGPSELGVNDWDLLRSRAEVAFAQDRYDEAVVWAQTACEILATATLRYLLAREVPRRVLDVLVPRSVSFRDDTSRTLFNEAAGVEIQREGWWSAYRAHLRLRHAVVHDGISVTREAAEASLGVTRLFMDHVDGASDATTRIDGAG